MPKRKPFIASGEFWVGVFTTFVCLALAIGFLASLAS